jgi:hypothetical protein
VNTAALLRLSGLSLLVGALVSAVASILSGVLFPGNDVATATNPLNIGLNVVSVVGGILALYGLPALYLHRAREGGLPWLVGLLLLALTALLFAIFLPLISATVLPFVATQIPAQLGEGPPASFIPIFIIGTLANVLSAALMGWAVLQRKLYPAGIGYLLALEAVLAAVGFFLTGPSNGDNLLSQILNVVSPLPLLAALAYLGYALCRPAMTR